MLTFISSVADSSRRKSLDMEAVSFLEDREGVISMSEELSTIDGFGLEPRPGMRARTIETNSAGVAELLQASETIEIATGRRLFRLASLVEFEDASCGVGSEEP